jgi:hypothetical protein
MSAMLKPFPPEFRRDVIAVARKGDAPIAQVAKDFRAGRWQMGDPDVLVVFDLAPLAFLLADLPVEVSGRLPSDRVFRLPAPQRTADMIGRPAKHGGEFHFRGPRHVAAAGHHHPHRNQPLRHCFRDDVGPAASAVDSPCGVAGARR